MTDPLTAARRWNSFVCPGCRCVFRVPQDHDGTGVVCPACRILLRLPGPDAVLPPLVTPPPALAEPVEVEEIDDDGEPEDDIAAARSDRNFIALLAVAGSALVALVAWWLIPDEKALPPVVAAPPPSVPGASPEEAPKPLILEVESVIKSFLEAPTREEALKWVVDPEATGAKWSEWLGGESYTAPGFDGLVGAPVTTGTGAGAVSVAQVRTGQFKLAELAVVKRDGRFKVDWDSWAGWSEMSWEDFLKEKPREPKRFRVLLSAVDYYNFSFRDDREWTSYRLDSPDGTDSLFGYVPRTGDLDQRLRPVDEGAKTKWLLTLKFPAETAGDNQVLIDGIVTEGWVAPATED